jgi:hypothetical protein
MQKGIRDISVPDVERPALDRVAAPPLPQTGHVPLAMNVRMNALAQSARAESLCEFCGRPWFGLVAYCPYCGRKPGFPTINKEPDDRFQTEGASASRPGALWRPAGELHRQGAKSPRKEPPGMPLRGAPVIGQPQPSPAERNRPTAARLNKTALTLLFKAVVAGVGALLLLWPAPNTNEGASPQLPVTTSGAYPRRGPATTAAPVPSIPLRTDSSVPPQSNRTPLCSVAHATAGLCKSQQ